VVRLNHVTVFGTVESVDIPVTLAADNSVEIASVSPTDSIEAIPVATAQKVSFRITQASKVKLHILSGVHYNTNVSNFEASCAFYGKLGFTTLSGFSDTNTQEIARAIGIETPTEYDGSKGPTAGGYLLHRELIGLGFMGGTIDLIEFTIPRDDEPPYARLNRLGMAKGVFYTNDLDRTWQEFSVQGIRFLSEPVVRADGTRFATFMDPDGTFY